MHPCFQKQLENQVGSKLQLKINDNRSTMVSVKWEPDCTKVSLHRMFLAAPKNVMEELACYLRRDHKTIAPAIKAFIEKGIRNLDYSHQLDPKKLSTQGTIYNLKKIYQDLNREYFSGRLNLTITWFGSLRQKNRSRITFGLYHDPLKLIKINRLMDSPLFPDYVVSFVVYHEMVHHVCPGFIDRNGLHHVHSTEFKSLEKQFQHYHLAHEWIKNHQALLFSQCY